MEISLRFHGHHWNGMKSIWIRQDGVSVLHLLCQHPQPIATAIKVVGGRSRFRQLRCFHSIVANHGGSDSLLWHFLHRSHRDEKFESMLNEISGQDDIFRLQQRLDLFLEPWLFPQIWIVLRWVCIGPRDDICSACSSFHATCHDRECLSSSSWCQRRPDLPSV